MTKALRGINLGGWLVTERWMTPELYEGVQGEGEIALVRELGSEAARERLEAHRQTFITEADFAWIARQGFDFVRLPVGYWLFEETTDFVDGEGYLRQAFEWASRHRLGIVLDFHGLQGSQNGQDHSGQVGQVRLYRHGNEKQALRTLEYMCRTYGTQESLLAIELINEPKVRWFLYRLLRYYDRAYRVATLYLRPETKIIVSDAFRPLRMARALARRRYGDRLVLDVHLYQLFSRREQARSFVEHIRVVEKDWSVLLDELMRYVPVLVGEWSAALPEKALAEASSNRAEKTERYYYAQAELFKRATWAHSYWSYKAPGRGPWNYREQISLQGR